MAKIYEFPKQYGIEDEIEECLYEIGKAYISTLNYAMNVLSSDNPTQEELIKIEELIMDYYVKGLDRAIEELFED